MFHRVFVWFKEIKTWLYQIRFEWSYQVQVKINIFLKLKSWILFFSESTKTLNFALRRLEHFGRPRL